MSKRIFQKYTIAVSNTAQPLIGTTTTAATGPFAIDRNGDYGVMTVPVTTSTMFQNGDAVIIGSKANGDEERVFVQKVTDATHVVLRGMTKTHVSGSFLRLAEMCQSIYVQTVAGNAANIYLGGQSLNPTGDIDVIAVLIPVAATGVQPIDYGDPTRGIANGSDVGQYWITGTAGDGYIPSLTVI